MFFNQKDKSYMNHWDNWAIDSIEKELLFQEIQQLVLDMIKELLPSMIEDYLKNRNDTLYVNVQTMLNGKINDLGDLRQDIDNYVNDFVRKNIK